MRLQFRPAGFGIALGIAFLLLLRCAGLAQFPGDERLDVRFGLPGSDNTVLSVASKGLDTYIAGDISSAGSRNVNHIARWNGTELSSLGSGIEGGTNLT